MKIFVSSSHSLPPAKILAKTLWLWDYFPSHHISLQIAESLVIPSKKE